MRVDPVPLVASGMFGDDSCVSLHSSVAADLGLCVLYDGAFGSSRVSGRFVFNLSQCPAD